MKKNLSNLFWVFLGIAIGYTLAYFNLFSYRFDFIYGVILGSICISLFLLLKLHKLSYGKLLLILTAIVVASGLISYFIKKQATEASFETFKESEELRIKQELVVLEAKNLQLRKLMEFESKTGLKQLKQLNDSIYQLVKKFSESLRPIGNFPPENAALAPLSPGRGELFLTVIGSNLDTVDKRRLIRTLNFQYADLRNVELKGLDLDQIDLRHAALSGSILTNSSLKDAKLDSTHFGQTILKGVNLEQASIENAHWEWSSIDSSSFKNAMANGLDLHNSEISNSSFSTALMRHVDLRNSIVKITNFYATDLYDSEISGTTFGQCNFVRSRPRLAKIKNTRFDSCEMDSLVVDPDWMDYLDKIEHPMASKIRNEFIYVEGAHEAFPLDKQYIVVKKQ